MPLRKKTILPLILGRNEKYAQDSRLRKTYLQIKSYFDIFEKFLAVKALMTSAIYIADKFYTSMRTLENYHESCHFVEYRLRAISANPGYEPQKAVEINSLQDFISKNSFIWRTQTDSDRHHEVARFQH